MTNARINPRRRHRRPSIYDGTALLTADMWAGSDWSPHRHLLDDANRLVVPVGAFLVRVDDKLLPRRWSR